MKAPTKSFLAVEKSKASAWARELFDHPDLWLIVDTETTGLDSHAEIIQLGILSPHGDVLMDRLLRPTIPIGADAEAIHGISQAMVEELFGYADYHEEISDILRGKVAVIFNANFDVRILRQSAAAWHLPSPIERSECAMLRYSHWFGEIGKYGDFRWQKLPAIEGQQAHSAIADCKATLDILKGCPSE